MHKVSGNVLHLRPLLKHLAAYNVSVDAVLEGHNPGIIYVDDVTSPQIALLTGPEGVYLSAVSEPTEAQITAVKALITDLMTNQGFEGIWMTCDPAWEAHVKAVFPVTPIQNERQHYICTALRLDWRAEVPDGFKVQPITAELLNRAELDIPEHVHDWIEANWQTPENFFQNGFGFVTEDIPNKRIISWSICDGIGAGACEIGIHTHEDYRQRGFAAMTAAAAVEHALTRGFKSVGWHCHTSNTGSWKTALKVGFVWERDYISFVAYSSEAVHWADAGRMYEEKGDFQSAADYYVRADSAADQPHWGHYIPYYAARMFAQLDDHTSAWQWLHRAVERGFDDKNALEHSAALTPLKSTPEWAALLERLT